MNYEPCRKECTGEITTVCIWVRHTLTSATSSCPDKVNGKPVVAMADIRPHLYCRPHHLRTCGEQDTSETMESPFGPGVSLNRRPLAIATGRQSTNAFSMCDSHGRGQRGYLEKQTKIAEDSPSFVACISRELIDFSSQSAARWHTHTHTCLRQTTSWCDRMKFEPSIENSSVTR